MGRKPRIEYAGATYHVMCRGNRREKIFQDDEDRRVFLETVGEVCERTGWKVCAYVLMPNHYHMVLETPEANLVAGMKWFQGTYTKRHNVRYRDWGHVFQGRYKSIVIDPEESCYFRTACDYVHLNPVRAQLIGGKECPKLQDYEWSSSWYLPRSSKKDPSWLNLRRIVEEQTHQLDSARARNAYLRDLESRATANMDAEEYKALRRGWCLGSAEFKAQLQEELEPHLNKLSRDSITGEARRMHDEREAERLLIETAALAGLDLEQMELLKRNDNRKEMVAWLLTKKTSVTQDWIAERLSMGNRANVSRAIRQINRSDKREVKEWKAKTGKMHICLH
jgi:putative transposase